MRFLFCVIYFLKSMKKGFKEKILLGITGRNAGEVIRKINDAENLKIKKASLFLEMLNAKERKKVYKRLEKTTIKEFPLVHIRDDMERAELEFLETRFKVKYFTIHEYDFNNLEKWKGFYKKLYLELNTDNFISKKVEVGKIGGFCVDLAHFKAAQEKWLKEFEYVIERKQTKKYFKCNHINGFDFDKNTDIHTIKNLSDFDYVKSLPQFLFGDVIALEAFNSIPEQIQFRSHLSHLLTN